jgi:hypothetical protein
MTKRLLVLAALAATLGALAPAAAAARPGTSARHALVTVQELTNGRGVRTGRELTPALNRLYAALPSLTGADRAAAEALLARPDDGAGDPPDTHKWSGPEAGGSPKCTDHFCVHWTATGADASTAPYAQSMADLFENEVYPCENGTGAASCAGRPGLGWRDPPADGGRGGDNRVDIYVQDLHSTERVFGYVALDPGQPREPSVPHFSYMVMDKDYSRFGDPTPEGALAAEQVTAAHEYNHVLQNGYDYLEDGWMFEATAVYMEDKVYPAIDDYLNYVSAWIANTKQPLTTFTTDNLKPYGSAVWNHWLDHRFGSAAIRSAWEQSVAAADFAPGAYSAAIAAAGGGSFGDEFGRFAAAVAEWRAPGAGLPDLYPDLPRDTVVPTGSQTAPFALPHTTFAIFEVPIPASNPSTIRMLGTLPAGTSGAIALVGRTGADSAAGTLTTNLTPIPTGGVAAVALDDPGQFGRITAVIVNADASHGGFDPAANDYVFTRDVPDAVVAMVEPGPPIPTTGPPGLLGDHSASVNAAVDPHLLETTWSIEYGTTTRYGSSTSPQQVPAATVGSAPVSAALPDLKANTTYHYRVVATNSAGAAKGADGTFKTARDVVKPVVTIKVSRQRLAKVRRRGLVYRARCSERCRGTAELVLPARLARRLHLPSRLGRARVALDADAKLATLRLPLGSRARRRLAGEARNLPANLRFRVADESRNSVALRRRLTLTRSPR